MIPINITNSDYCNNCNIAGFTPGAHFAFDGTHSLTLYDTSILPAGVNFIKAKYKASDKFGNSVQGEVALSGSGHTVVLNTSTLNVTKGVDIRATVIADGIIADGGIYCVSLNAAISGVLATWDPATLPSEA